MKFYYITFRSVTFAQRGEELMKRAGIDCSLQRTPKSWSHRGCGYSLRVRDSDALSAVTLLRDSGVSFGKLYAIGDDGKVEERLV